MNSSTSSSRGDRRFLAYIAAFLAVSWAVCELDIWRGLEAQHRQHQELVRRFGSEVDFVILGDSKTRAFNFDGLMPYLTPYKGMTFNAELATPCYHLHNFRRARERVPGFRPRVVFVCIGANNFNANGIHCRRDAGLFDLSPLGESAQLVLDAGDYEGLAELVASRPFALYRHRTQITHLQLRWNRNPLAFDRYWDEVSWRSAHGDGPDSHPALERDPMRDRNYTELCRRSIYNSFEYSPVSETALAALVDEIRAVGGTAVLVLLPVSEEMMQLEDELVGDTFREAIGSFAAARKLRLLDLRRQHGYNFHDMNHLSHRGAVDAARDHFAPVLNELLGK